MQRRVTGNLHTDPWKSSTSYCTALTQGETPEELVMTFVELEVEQKFQRLLSGRVSDQPESRDLAEHSQYSLRP